MERRLFTARLEHKLCLSESGQCFHLRFVIDELEVFPFDAGQFLSVVATDSIGKQQTRAYSIASAPSRNRFDLCVNRVGDGFFSNYLADLSAGQTIQVHGPHGHFVLHAPFTDSIFVAVGTGIAPVRGFTESLFPGDGSDKSEDKEIWLIHGAGDESELYYRDEFEKLATARPNFHYMTTLSQPGSAWGGLRGPVQDYVGQVVEQRAARLGLTLPLPAIDPATPAAALQFDVHAYVCGLNEMVSAVRERLKSYGWHRKQIVFERYD